jgi:DNA-binding response OmpR family regulator
MSKRILWVDDEIELLKSHVLFLQEKGYQVHTATNGADALTLVRDGKFDIMLLDESMPGRGGLDTLVEIKESDPGLPVVMITKNEMRRWPRKSGCDWRASCNTSWCSSRGCRRGGW